ncbi:MAG: peptidoglycan-binding domain-containing protein [Myxococcota bacterium]
MTSAIDTSRTTTHWTPAPSIADAQNGGEIRRGAQGESVRQIQGALAQRGYQVQVDGKFGVETDRAVRAFQRSQPGLDVDGIVGPNTLARLNQPGADPTTQPVRREGVARAPTLTPRGTQPDPTTLRAGDLARADETRRNVARNQPGLAPANATPEERYRFYSDIVRRNGGQVNPNGQPTVLGLRGISRDTGTHDTTNARRYDDTFVVLQPNGKAYEFTGATHPGQLASSLPPDVNGDGRRDIGMINAGNYYAAPNGPHNGAASYVVTTNGRNGNIPGVRDTNGDGAYSADERAASARRGDTIGEILFHQGYSDHPKSIGCQTLAPADYARFMDALGGTRARFNYTLVEAGR